VARQLDYLDGPACRSLLAMQNDFLGDGGSVGAGGQVDDVALQSGQLASRSLPQVQHADVLRACREIGLSPMSASPKSITCATHPATGRMRQNRCQGNPRPRQYRAVTGVMASLMGISLTGSPGE
jgi:hypothetical protein